MKIRKLELRAFGGFDGVTLDFGASEAGLHVVYGDNEAGKSTTLRALEAVLFGIPANTRDAYRHAMKDLRIGIEVEAADGRVLECVRRKGRQNTLLDVDGGPLDEAKLRDGFLCGIDRERFRAMFGLDQVRLRQGAQALLAEDGDVGASLFDAGVGGRGIHSVLAELDQAADAIFRPHASKRRLNLAVTEYEDARRAFARRGADSCCLGPTTA